MNQEVLKLALEWAEANGEIVFAGGGMDAVNKMNSWATAIKEALREKAIREVQRLGQEIEQEPVVGITAIRTWFKDGRVVTQTLCNSWVDTTPPQPEQEPVAWMSEHRFDELRQGFTVMTTLTKQRAFDDDVALYTTPPQRTWVGLTDEDVNGFVGQYWGDEYMKMRSMVRAIEAKLKEKNT